MITTKQKINNGFRKLRQAGYIAKQKFWCCQFCGWSAITSDYPNAEKVVFYHAQDAECIKDDGSLEFPLYLAWSGDCKEIANIFIECGLIVDHDGSEDTRIKILPE